MIQEMRTIISLPGKYDLTKELGVRGFKVAGKHLIKGGHKYHMPRSIERALKNPDNYSGFNFELRPVTNSIKSIIASAQKPKVSKPTFILNDTSVSFFHDGQMHQTSSSNPMFKDIVAKLRKGDLDDATKLTNIAQAIERASKGIIKNDGGILKYVDQNLHETVQDWIMRNMNKGNPAWDAVINFMGRCKLNENPESIEQLWQFIRACGLIITPTGHFIGYKYVDDNFMDKHTGKLNYSLGKIVEMPRDMVEFNPEIACGPGIHVGAMNYVNGHSTIIELLVDPKDVVSVPRDHNNEKLRACRVQSWKVLKHKGVTVSPETTQDEFFPIS